MTIPLLLSRNIVHLPGTEAGGIRLPLAAFAGSSSPASADVLLGFDKGYASRKPSPETVATTATIGRATTIGAAKEGKVPCAVDVLRRVRLKDVAAQGEGWSADYEDCPESVSESGEEESNIRSAKGVIAEFIRKNGGKPSDLTRRIAEERDPALLAYLSHSSFKSLAAANRGYRYFSTFDSQTLLETDPASAKLRLIINEYCQRLSLTPDQCGSFDPNDPLWGPTPDDPLFGFVPVGEIASDGTIVIGCPSHLSARRPTSKDAVCAVKAAPGGWSVFRILSTLGDSDPTSPPRTSYVLSRGKPEKSWIDRITAAPDSYVNVRSGCIAAVQSGLLPDLDGSDDFQHWGSVGREIAETDSGGRQVSYLVLSTGGDGAFPVRIINDAQGNLQLAAIILDE